ncbi:LacI family DNA-binding transcriptional regulator [Nonomuraea sp. NPDC002799]
MTNRSRPTVRDVASAAGVSAMTVSRVLNRSPLVAPETADRVREVMEQIGFRLNQSARNLRQGRTTTMIGLVVDDVANPFYASLSREVEQVAERHDALLVVASYGSDLARERRVVTTLLERGLDGLLMYPAAGDHGYLSEELLDKRPVVLLGRRPGGVDTDSVGVDNVGAAMRAVLHLFDHGHRRIGLVGYGQAESGDDPNADHRLGRIEGYRRGLASAGIGYDPDLVRLRCAGVNEAATAVRDLLALPDPPTALFAMNNRMTVGALRVLGTGLGGVALVGFDDFELADVFDPPITVVAPDPGEMGRRAAEILFARLGGDERPIERTTLGAVLIARGSGELRPRTRP